MLKVLENPITNNFLDLKNFILSNDFIWRYDTSTGMPFYGHTFLERPEETGFSQPLSELVNLNLTVLKEIIEFNKLFDRYFFDFFICVKDRYIKQSEQICYCCFSCTN